MKGQSCPAQGAAPRAPHIPRLRNLSAPPSPPHRLDTTDFFHTRLRQSCHGTMPKSEGNLTYSCSHSLYHGCPLLYLQEGALAPHPAMARSVSSQTCPNVSLQKAGLTRRRSAGLQVAGRSGSLSTQEPLLVELLFFYKDDAARSAGADGRSLRLLRETGGALFCIPTRKINK